MNNEFTKSLYEELELLKIPTSFPSEISELTKDAESSHYNNRPFSTKKKINIVTYIIKAIGEICAKNE